MSQKGRERQTDGHRQTQRQRQREINIHYFVWKFSSTIHKFSFINSNETEVLTEACGLLLLTKCVCRLLTKQATSCASSGGSKQTATGRGL